MASVLDGFRPFRSPAILRPFLEAYRVVAGLIEDDAYMGTIDESTLVNRALKAGRDQLAAGTITSGQSVSKILFETAVTLARHRGMFEPGPDVVERRKAFAAEIDELAARMRRLGRLYRSDLRATVGARSRPQGRRGCRALSSELSSELVSSELASPSRSPRAKSGSVPSSGSVRSPRAKSGSVPSSGSVR